MYKEQEKLEQLMYLPPKKNMTHKCINAGNVSAAHIERFTTDVRLILGSRIRHPLDVFEG